MKPTTKAATHLGSYLGDYMRPAGILLDDMETEDRRKSTMAAAARDLGLSAQSALSRKLSGERPITELETIQLAHNLGAIPSSAVLLRLADVLACSPGSVEEMVAESLREAGKAGAPARRGTRGAGS